MVQLPYGANVWPATIWAQQLALHFVTRAKSRLSHPAHLVRSCVFTQRMSQDFPLFYPKSELFKESRLACAETVLRVEQIPDDLLLLDSRLLNVR